MPTRDSVRLLLRLAFFIPLGLSPLFFNWMNSLPSVQRWILQGYRPMSDALLQRKTVWIEEDFRSLKAAWMLRLPAAPDVLILGSSRAIHISEDWFRPRTLVNAAVFNGDLDDMVAFFQICHETGKFPKTVLLELNPTLSHETTFGDDRILRPYFHRALSRYRLFPSLRIFADLLSLRRLRLNLLHLRPQEWALRGDSASKANRVDPDGTVFYPGEDLEPAPARLEALMREHMEGLSPTLTRWRGTSTPDAFDRALLRCFLDDLESHHIRVVTLMAPLHPTAYALYSSRGGYREDWIRGEMAARHIPVVGSYRPDAVRAASSDFIDDVHPRPVLVHRLLSEAGITSPSAAPSSEVPLRQLSATQR